MYATAQIDLTKPSGRRLLRELETKKCVEIETPNPGISGTWHKMEDVIEEGFDKLSAHYGVDMRKLSKEYKNLYK